MAGSHLSRDFFDLIKAIGEAKSKQEEDRIVVIEVAEAKKRQGDRTLTGKRLKEYLLRLVYVEMLGHDASFGYMKAVEMSASSNLLEKRVAYLCAGLCFAPEHEFRMMLVNRLQRDLQSANVLEISIALSACAKILTTDMIPAVLPIVQNLLKHDQEIVRKKTIMLLHRFLQLSPESVSHMGDKFRRALCDKDPSVMGASLHLFAEMMRTDPGPYKDLVPSFVSILKQVVEHRLPRDFDYHRVPAPWLQMKMLRILAAQGRADQASSEQMYEVLLDVIRRGDTGTNVGYAILYECVKTVTTIYPNAALLDAAAASIARFITSESHNLKYLGVTGLAAIVKDHPKYAAEHQLAVIDCLEDPDDTLKRKTLDLLYRMINPVNVEVIVAKLLDHLGSATDTFLRSDLVTRITAAAERFAPSNVWYVSTIAAAFELGGELVRPEVASNLIRLIAEGSGESAEADAELRRVAVGTFLALADKPQLPNVLLQTLFWTVGEYGYLCQAPPAHTLTTMCEKLVELAGRTGLDVPTRGHALAALCKLAAQLAASGLPAPASFTELCTKLASSRHADHSQRVAELGALLARPALMRAVLPVDASTEDIEVDLGFTDAFVAEAVASGARTYSKPVGVEEGGGGEGAGGGGGGGLRFDAYETQQGNFNLPVEEVGVGGGAGGGGAGAGGPAQLALPGGGLKSAGMWGKEGYKSSAGAVLAEGKAEAAKATPAGPWGSSGSGSSSAVATTSMAAFTAGVESSSSASGSASGSSSFASSSAPAAAPAPRELTEREKMAAAMFGGVGGGASSSSSAGSKLGGGAAAGASLGASKFGAKAPAFGPGSASAAAAAVVTPTPAVAAQPVPQQAAAQPPPPQASSAAIDLLDIFSSPAPTPAASAPQPTSFGAAADPFGLSFAATPSAAALADPFAPAPPRNPLAAVPAQPPPALLAALPALACAAPGEHRSPPTGLTPLCTAGDLSLGYAKVYAAEGLHLLLWVVNASATSPSPPVGLGLTPPAFLAPSLRAGASGAALPYAAGQATPLGALRPGESAAFAVTLTLCAVPAGGVLSVALLGGAQPCSGVVEISVHDVLRPAPLDTPSFGAIWTQPAMAGEAVHVIPACRYTAPEALLERVRALHFNPVQAIAATQESISAARVMAMPSVYALLHTRCSAAGVELRVRAPDKAFTAAVLEVLVKLLR